MNEICGAVPTTEGSSAKREVGDPRPVPCFGCLCSAYSGKSRGTCYDNKLGGERCFMCASGHRCTPM